jgi:hypothetical protein
VVVCARQALHWVVLWFAQSATVAVLCCHLVRSLITGSPRTVVLTKLIKTSDTRPIGCLTVVASCGT